MRIVLITFLVVSGTAILQAEPTTRERVPADQAAASVRKAVAVLDQAREDLRISEEAQRQVRERLKDLKAQPEADPLVVLEYEEYLKRLDAVALAQRNKLDELEALYTEKNGEPGDAAKPLVLDQDEKWKAPDKPVIEADSVEALEKEFNESLSSFDDFLLREQDNLSAEMTMVAERANSAIEQLTRRAQESKGQLEKKGEKPPGLPANSSKEKPAKKSNAKEKVQQPPKHSVPPPATRRGDPSSDDVVARQLREAAENEQDPELREKLWAEYDSYKEGISE